MSLHGVDGASCGATAPCRTWQYAMDNETQPGGEVLTLDSGGFGTLIITKDIKIILPPGVYGGMSPAIADGVMINAPGANVVLRGLTINAQVNSVGGIVILAAGSVTIENSVISKASGGILAPALPVKLFIQNTTISDNSSHGLYIGSGSTAHVVNSTFRGNGYVFGAGVAVYSLVFLPINNETCIMLSHTHPMTRSWLCDKRNCISATRIVS